MPPDSQSSQSHGSVAAAAAAAAAPAPNPADQAAFDAWCDKYIKAKLQADNACTDVEFIIQARLAPYSGVTDNPGFQYEHNMMLTGSRLTALYHTVDETCFKRLTVAATEVNTMGRRTLEGVSLLHTLMLTSQRSLLRAALCRRFDKPPAVIPGVLRPTAARLAMLSLLLLGAWAVASPRLALLHAAAPVDVQATSMMAREAWRKCRPCGVSGGVLAASAPGARRLSDTRRCCPDANADADAAETDLRPTRSTTSSVMHSLRTMAFAMSVGLLKYWPVRLLLSAALAAKGFQVALRPSWTCTEDVEKARKAVLDWQAAFERSVVPHVHESRCPLCHEDFDGTRPVCVLSSSGGSCGHVSCEECILELRRRSGNPTCGLCKRPFEAYVFARGP